MSDQDLDPAAFQDFLRQGRPQNETLAGARARLDRRVETLPMPEGVDVEPIVIGGVPGERLTPKGAERGRTLLYFHGGGYRVGSPRSHRFAAAYLAMRAGCTAVVPEYRKAPEHRFPAAIDDAFAVCGALTRAGEALVLAGDSAGGGLALATAVRARDAGLASPAGVLLISPWIDLAHEGSTYAANAHLDPTDLAGLKVAAADYAGKADLRDPMISPLHADLAGLPPLMISVGADETLLSDSTRLAARAAEARLDLSLRVYPRLVHNFAAHMAVLANARLAMAEAGAWIAVRYGCEGGL